MAATTGTQGFRDDLAQQLVLMGETSPSYRRLLRELDALLASPTERELAASFERVWQKRTFEAAHERPLLLQAALRADAQREGPSHPLYAAIAAENPDARAIDAASLRAALAPERIGFWITLRTRRVQTNETTRSLVWLWPATLAGAGGRARPIQLYDVGASAGLNLVAEALDIPWKAQRGERLRISRDLDVRLRRGFDPRPLDARRPEDCDWLKACIWPEQRERLSRLEQALSAFRRAVPPVELVLAGAASVPSRLEHSPGQLAIVYHSLIAGYVPKDERDLFESGVRAWLAAGRRGERVWSRLELEETGPADTSCALDVEVSTGDGTECVRLAKTGYHPTAVTVTPGAEDRLKALFR
ncbi:MAG: DUF2332 family protein [Polyangiaceae bacterium]